MFSVLQKLGWFFRMNWPRYTTAITLLFLAGLLEVIPPWLIGYTIDGIHLGTIGDQQFLQIVIGWAAIGVVGYLVTYIWFYQLFGGAFVLERLLRSRLMRHLLKMTPTFYERNRTGDLMARATNDLKAVAQTAGFGILTLVDSTLFMLTIIVFMASTISLKLTLAALLPLPIMALVLQYFGKKIHERFMDAQNEFGSLNDEVLEAVAGVRVIRAFVQEDASLGRFKGRTGSVYRKNIAVAQIEALFEPTMKILVGISYLIGLCYGGYLVARSELTLGELVSFNIFLGMLIWPMIAIGELINIMQRGNASLDRVTETLNYKEDVADTAEGFVSEDQPSSIAFNAVSFRYPSAVSNNLTNVNFHLHQGKTLGVVGRTGSGKTTLLKQLLREYPLGTGEIAVSGVPLQGMPKEQLLGWIGYVPQQPILFSKSIRDNIFFGLEQGTEEDLQRALERASFAKDIQFLPDGLDTMVGEKGVALSGGQKQRVSIARALIANPQILLLDDALSAVDGKTEAEIIEGIRTERAGKTTIITTHRLSAVQHADWILVLDEGRVVQEGTHEQLLAQNGWYREQYDRQQLEAVIESE